MSAEIDLLTDDFYQTVCFQNSKIPDIVDLKVLFVNDGMMINNSFAEPIIFNTETFLQALETQVAAGNLAQFMQREVSAKTEIFGSVAQRISVYEYTFADHETDHMPRGVNFIQYIQSYCAWKITSMIWNDENENRIIPAEYLG